MSVTTDTIDAIRREIKDAGQHPGEDYRIKCLVWIVEALTDQVEKLHARVLFLEQQQSSKENY